MHCVAVRCMALQYITAHYSIVDDITSIVGSQCLRVRPTSSRLTGSWIRFGQSNAPGFLMDCSLKFSAIRMDCMVNLGYLSALPKNQVLDGEYILL